MGNKVHFGFKNVWYSVLTETTSGGVTTTTYGTIKPWAGGVSLNIEPKGEVSHFRADDSNYWDWGASNGYEGDFVSAGVPDDAITDVFGEQRDNNNYLVESESDVIKKIALLCESDGNVKAERFCFYNCTLGKPSIEMETTGEDGNEPKTVSCSVTISPRPDDGVVRVKADATTDPAKYASFFTTMPQPDFTPPEPPDPEDQEET